MPPIAYRYCGLTLRSTLALPELEPAAAGEAVALEIREASVPATLAGAARRAPLFEIGADEALWRLDGVARYRIADGGRLIEVEPAPRAAPEAVRLLLLQPVFTLAALLRGEFLLNAAAVEVGGSVIAFTGPSAAGKSTAAAILASHGYDVVADGLLRLTLGPEGGVLAHPQAPWLLLWPDAVERLVLGRVARPVRPGIELRRVGLSAAPGPLPLARIAVLREQRGDDLERFEPVAKRGLGGFEALLANTAGGLWIDGDAELRRRHFPWAAAVAGAARVEHLELPWGWSRLDPLAEALERWSEDRG